MSKLYKSDECIEEAHPCRLEPIDVDAFFINNDFPENEAILAPEETIFNPETNKSGACEPAQMEDNESIDISRISDFAEKLKAYIEGEQEQAGTSELTEEQTTPPQDDGMAGFREVMEKAKQEAEKIFCGAKSEADELTQSAKIQADELTEKAKYQAEELTQVAKKRAEELSKKAENQAKELTYSAKIQADSILEGAKSKYHELTDGARQQASSILEGAQRQAGDIKTKAERQAEQVIDDARQQAGFITESANRKAAELLEKAKQQSDLTIKAAEEKAAELLEATKQQTEEMLAKAKQQTEEMLAKAKEQAEEIKAQAKLEGFEAGHTEGLTKARQEYEGKLADAITIIAQAEEARLFRIRSSEPELLKLAVAIAEKIIGMELKTDPVTQVAIVKQALAGIPTAGTLTIKVNPEDHRFIEENLAEFQKVFSEPIPVKIQRDQGVEMGNCFIETDHGNIDARIKTQLDMIMAEILKMRRPECT